MDISCSISYIEIYEGMNQIHAFLPQYPLNYEYEFINTVSIKELLDMNFSRNIFHRTEADVEEEKDIQYTADYNIFKKEKYVQKI